MVQSVAETKAKNTIKVKHNVQIQSAVDAFDGSVSSGKALARQVKSALPAQLLSGASPHQLDHKRSKRKTLNRDTFDQIDASYDQLDGEWRDWLEVARRYEVRVKRQDRLDIRHTIILTLATARRKTTEPIPLYRAYRIASYCIAHYYYAEASINRGLDCKHCPTARRRYCAKYNLYSECPKVREVVSLDRVWIDADGETHSTLDTIADDSAVDLDQWIDARVWLRGCPTRLVEIALKIIAGQPLESRERKYLCKMRRRVQKPLF